MFKTSYDVVVYNEFILAFNIDSYDEADLIRQQWLSCYPNLKISICPHLITSSGGDSLVKETI